MNKPFLIKILATLLVMNVLLTTELVEAAVQEGEKAVDFKLKTVEDKEIQLSNFRGKVVILNFWTTWCAYCQEEMEELIKFSSDTKSSNVELIGLNVTSSERNEQVVKQFAKGLGLPFHIGLDVHGEVLKAYHVIGIPTTFIIDQKGIIRKKILGPVTMEMLQNSISQIE